jgi:16S rRNA (cytosine967-C5)-methyltransferase
MPHPSETRPRYKQKPLNKKEMIMKAFDDLWVSLFSSPVHLDSLLSKQPKPMKSSLARMVSPILLRPVSEAESFGVGVQPGEPWSAKLSAWKTASLTASRTYDSLSNPPENPAPMREDFPPYMVEALEKDHGAEIAKNLYSTLGREAPMSLRSTRKWGGERLIKELRKETDFPVKVEVSDLSPFGVRLAGYTPVFASKPYEEGAFEIQDEGSQIMSLFSLWPELYAPLLQDAPGNCKPKRKVIEPPIDILPWTVIDTCAGAGGKSLAIADALKGKGRVFSYDTSDKKLLALKKRAKRAGLNNIQTLVLENENELEKLKKFRRSANAVLVDAPCSGWGVLRRNPDIKWRQDPSVLERMPRIQKRLLDTYSDLVAPGGTLTYGLCTFRKAETTEIVKAFLAEHSDFVPIAGGYLGPGPCDGFFMQAFRRKAK